MIAVLTDHPTIGADLKLVPGMTFAMEPNYVFGQHLAYLGGTVIVGDRDPIDLDPYTAQILRAEGNDDSAVSTQSLRPLFSPLGTG